MKRKYILATVAVLAAIVMIGIVGKSETHYERTGSVTESSAGIILVKDDTGNLWKLKSTEFEVGDDVVLDMHTNGSSAITDDVVVGIKAEG